MNEVGPGTPPVHKYRFNPRGINWVVDTCDSARINQERIDSSTKISKPITRTMPIVDPSGSMSKMDCFGATVDTRQLDIRLEHATDT